MATEIYTPFELNLEEGTRTNKIDPAETIFNFADPNISNQVYLVGLDQDPIIIEYHDFELIFDNVPLLISPDLEKRRAWLSEHDGKMYFEDLEEYYAALSKYKSFKETLSDKEIKNAILIYLGDFPSLWTGDLISILGIDPEIVLNSIKELEQEEKIKPRNKMHVRQNESAN